MKHTRLLIALMCLGALVVGCQPPLEVKEVDQGKVDRIINEVETSQ